MGVPNEPVCVGSLAQVEKFSRQNNKLQRKVEASEKSMTDEELDAAVQAVTGEVQGLKVGISTALIPFAVMRSCSLLRA